MITMCFGCGSTPKIAHHKKHQETLTYVLHLAKEYKLTHIESQQSNSVFCLTFDTVHGDVLDYYSHLKDIAPYMGFDFKLTSDGEWDRSRQTYDFYFDMDSIEKKPAHIIRSERRVKVLFLGKGDSQATLDDIVKIVSLLAEHDAPVAVNYASDGCVGFVWKKYASRAENIIRDAYKTGQLKTSNIILGRWSMDESVEQSPGGDSLKAAPQE